MRTIFTHASTFILKPFPSSRGYEAFSRGDCPISGFTLIELMIVIGIISILASLALPSYQSYTRRARFAEVMMTADAFKSAVSLALQEGIPSAELTNGNHGIPATPTSSKNLASVSVTNGIITATGSSLTEDATLILTPDEDSSHWSLTGSCLAKGYCHD